MSYKIILTVFLVGFFNNGYSQQPIHKTLITVKETEQLFFETINENKHEIVDEAITSSYDSHLVFFFLFYKKIFSRNDMPSTCKFHPSCGSYGSLAIQKNGLIKGFLQTFDRLQRCNGTHSIHQYKYLPSTNIYVDLP